MARSVGATNSSKESWALTGLPGKPITGMPRYAPVACGPPGCIATLPTHPPSGSSSLAHHLVGAHRDAAARDHELGVGVARGIQLVAQPADLVAHPCLVHDDGADGAHGRGERDAVRIGNLAGPELGTGRHELAARAHDRDAHPFAHEQLGEPGCRGGGEVTRREPQPGRQHVGARGQVGAGLPHVLPRGARPEHAHARASAAPPAPAGPSGSVSSTGTIASAPSGTCAPVMMRTVVPGSSGDGRAGHCSDLAHDRQRDRGIRHVGGADREAVHLRVAERRERDRRLHR